jgi:hypothetical protein
MKHRGNLSPNRPIAALLAAVALAALATAPIEAQAKPDLRISRISTPGGLCAGSDGKVQVNVNNSSQLAPARGTVVVKLTISQPPAQPTAHIAEIQNGVGPNGNQAAWFHNVPIPATGTVTLHAVVNPDQAIEESNYGNNDKLQTANVTTVCGAPPPPPPGYTMTVTAYRAGTWQAGQYQAIAGADVSVTCGTFSANGQTGSNGKVAIAGVPKSPPNCAITVSKTGCTTNTLSSYKMPAYNASVNRDLTCN